MDKKSKLKKMYMVRSKHSGYQILPSSIQDLFKDEQLDVNTRYEKERLTYIFNKLTLKNKNIIDIGGNTGYFTFELLKLGAKFVHYYEGNSEHAAFVELAQNILKIENKLKITNAFFEFNHEIKIKYDVALLLNVLHHIGDDYGNKNIDIEKAKLLIIEQINKMLNIANTIVLQIGFNWQGNTDQCLFNNGTKKELIDFVRDGIKNSWTIQHIGIAERVKNTIKYCDLDETNIQRNDSLGEFLNRPIFILSS